jgi:hypothetical protein
MKERLSSILATKRTTGATSEERLKRYKRENKRKKYLVVVVYARGWMISNGIKAYDLGVHQRIAGGCM